MFPLILTVLNFNDSTPYYHQVPAFTRLLETSGTQDVAHNFQEMDSPRFGFFAVGFRN